MAARIATQEREPVELDDRGSMSDARKTRIWKSRKGICWMCGQMVPMLGSDVRYDHKLCLDLGGKDEDANLWPLHREPCDRIKTAADRKRIDKHRRQSKLRLDVPRTVSANPIRSPGFKPAQRRPAKSRRGK